MNEDAQRHDVVAVVDRTVSYRTADGVVPISVVRDNLLHSARRRVKAATKMLTYDQVAASRISSNSNNTMWYDDDSDIYNGWSSPISHPYRPLGAPDLKIRKIHQRLTKKAVDVPTTAFIATLLQQQQNERKKKEKTPEKKVMRDAETIARATKLEKSLAIEHPFRKIPKCKTKTVARKFRLLNEKTPSHVGHAINKRQGKYKSLTSTINASMLLKKRIATGGTSFIKSFNTKCIPKLDFSIPSREFIIQRLQEDNVSNSESGLLSLKSFMKQQDDLKHNDTNITSTETNINVGEELLHPVTKMHQTIESFHTAHYIGGKELEKTLYNWNQCRVFTYKKRQASCLTLATKYLIMTFTITAASVVRVLLASL